MGKKTAVFQAFIFIGFIGDCTGADLIKFILFRICTGADLIKVGADLINKGADLIMSKAVNPSEYTSCYRSTFDWIYDGRKTARI